MTKRGAISLRCGEMSGWVPGGNFAPTWNNN